MPRTFGLRLAQIYEVQLEDVDNAIGRYRRVAENASGGTDHGAGSLMFMASNKVKAGLLGQYPSLAPGDLLNGDLKHNVDFRSVYATMMKEWMGFDDTKSVLKGSYPTLGVFA